MLRLGLCPLRPAGPSHCRSAPGSEAEVAGTVRGAQRFVDPAIYDTLMPGLVAEIGRAGVQQAEVQVLSLGDRDFVAIPAEYFVEYGLRIKRRPIRGWAIIVGYANGMVGYVPTREAFRRGGYETTFTGSSKLAPEAGELLAEAAIELLRADRGQNLTTKGTKHTKSD